MNFINFKLTTTVAILLLMYGVNILNASHIAGGSITHKCLGGNKYEITLVVYRDCMGWPMQSALPIYFFNLSCGDSTIASNYASLPNVSIKNVSQLCPRDSLKSTCVIGTGGFQGYEEHTYKGTITLPKECKDWVVFYSLASNFYERNFAITNIADLASGGSFYTIIDNTNGKCNDSPYYTAPYPLAYVCVNQPTTYSFGAVGTPGNTMSFNLMPALNSSLGSLPYVAPYSYTNPIDGIVHDSVTGLLSFTPTSLGVFVVVQRAREYDSLGNLLSITMRDVQIVVENCAANSPPNASSGVVQNLLSPAIKTGNYSVALKEGDSLSFFVVINDSNLTDTVTLQSNITAQLPGATFSYVGTNPDTAFIKWKVPSGMAGTSPSFTITAADNYCPLRAQQTFVYTINVIGGTKAGPSAIICKGDSVQLNVTGGTSFTWSVVSGDAMIVGTNFSCDTCYNPVASPTITTVYEVVSDLLKDNRDTVTITVKSVLDATITQVGPFCESASAVNLTAVDTSGIWIGKGITDTIKGTFNPTTAGFGTHTITYSINDLCGNTDTVKIFVDSLKNATITQAGPYCESNASVTLKAVDAGGTWSGTGTSSGGIFNPSTAGSGTHTITYTITGVCSDVDTMKITVDSIRDASISSAGPFCISDNPYNLKAAEAGGKWYGTGTDSINGTFSPSKASAGKYVITYSITGVCSATDTETVVVVSSKDATITQDGPFCLSEASQSLQAASFGGSWSGNGITDTVKGIFTPTSAGAGTHTITYTISGLCGNTDTVSLVVAPLVDATINPILPLCPDALPFNLSAKDTGGIWKGTGITDNVKGTFAPVTAGVDTHTISYSITGTCSDTDTVFVVVLPPMAVTVSTKDESCHGCDGTASATISNGIPPFTYIWDTQTGGQTDSIAFNLCAGTYAVTVTDSMGCTDDFSETVMLGPSPVASFSAFPQPASISNSIVYFTDESIGDVTQWNWTFFDTSATNVLDTSSKKNASFAYPAAGIYFTNLTITDKNGCIDDTTLQIILYEDFIFYIPNAFTPNGDDINDFFGPKGIGIDEGDYSLLIFNRWGEVVFETNDLYTYWDGTYEGEPVQKGVYVWKIIVAERETTNKQKHEYIGHVTVLN